MANTASTMYGHVVHAPLVDHRNPRASHLEVVEPKPGDSRSARGNLYILIELIGGSPVSSYAVREMQSLVEKIYYSASGPVSAVLEQAVKGAHQSLLRLNRSSADIDLQAGIICAAIVQGHLVIASAGPTVALVSTTERLDQFPLDAERYAGNIGNESEPNISVYRQTLESGDALFLGESEWFLQSDIRTIGGAIVSTSVSNLHEVVEHLRKGGEGQPLLGLLLVYSDQVLPTGEDEETGSARLPTAVGTAPPVRTVSTQEKGREPQSAADSQRGFALQLPSAPRMQHQLAVPFRPFRRLRGPWHERISSFMRRTRHWMSGLLVGLLPEERAKEDSPLQQPAWEEPPESAVAAPSASAEEVPQPPPNEDFQLPALPNYAPPEPTMGNRRRLIIAIAILIPLLTSAVVGAAFLREGSLNQEEGLQLVELADSKLLQVQRALSVDDRATARAALSEAQIYLDEAIVLIGVTEQIQELSGIIATELQDLLQVTPLYSLDFPLLAYPADASPRRIVVSDQDIYVFDDGRQVVEHYRTNSERTLLEENNEAILREGDVVGSVTVGRIVDIAWQPRISGFADKASLLVLDRNNNVFRYNRLDGATHLSLREQSSLGSVGQLAIYNGRLYLADERSNQIFRYLPAGLAYDDPPTEWFNEQVQGDLSALVAMAIDGDIWLLSEDGSLLRYREGEQLPFSLERIPGIGGLLTDFVMDMEPEGLLYLADATEERILVYDKDGRYVEQYIDAERMALAGLRGLFLDELTSNLYILTSTSLYAHPLPR